MKNLNRFLISIIILFSGMIGGSLRITHSEHWKIYLPVVLITLSVKLTLDNKD